MRVRFAFAALFALAVALVLTSCGGDEERQTATSGGETVAGGAEQGAQPAGAPTGGGEAEATQGNGESAESAGEVQEGAIHAERPLITDTSDLPEPREGSKRAAPGVPTSRGADNSIQLWGVEASASEREEVTSDLQAFFDARVEGEWARACSYLSLRSRATFEGIGGRRSIAACAKGMAFLNRGVSKESFEREANIEDVLSLRIDERFAFLIYTRGDGLLYAIGFEREGDAWKIVSVSPNELGRVGAGG